MSVRYQITDTIVRLDQLILDPNNYRLAYDPLEPAKSDDEAIDNKVQEEVLRKITKEKLQDLKDSILENGFLEIDRIVVRKLTIPNKDLFLVVEGNRRTAALKSLLDEHNEGLIELPASLLTKVNRLNVVAINTDSDGNYVNYASTLMGVRHVSGPKKWTGMQSAKLICDLFKQDMSATQIGSLLGISAIEANRRKRGYLAYNQMANDPKYGKKIKNKHYTLLLEFLAKKSMHNWLNWSDEKQIQNSLARDVIYSHITEGPNGEKPEINNPTQARELIKAISIPRYKEQLESKKMFSELGAISADSEDIGLEINNFISFLQNIDQELLTASDMNALDRIIQEVNLLKRDSN
ncbi:MAG: ParB/Srx family N-terminal domain-containing protein [Pseudomonadota bacterium]|nr:ParB/Srx family N-terminal domain-containing protein [Pseudomonadota bacterium]